LFLEYQNSIFEISEGSGDSEDWTNDAENLAVHHRKKNTF